MLFLFNLIFLQNGSFIFMCSNKQPFTQYFNVLQASPTVRRLCLVFLFFVKNLENTYLVHLGLAFWANYHLPSQATHLCELAEHLANAIAVNPALLPRYSRGTVTLRGIMFREMDSSSAIFYLSRSGVPMPPFCVLRTKVAKGITKESRGSPKIESGGLPVCSIFIKAAGRVQVLHMIHSVL